MAGKASSSSTSTSRCTQYRPAAALSWSRAWPSGRGQPAVPQRGRGELGIQPGIFRQNAPIGDCLTSVPGPKQDEPGPGYQRRADGSGPGRRAMAGDHRDRHVGRLAGLGGLAVVQVQVPVQVAEPDLAERVPGPAERAGQQRAAAAEQERQFPGRYLVPDQGADGLGGGQHGRPAEHPGGRVAVPADQPDVQVAAVGRADRGRQPGGAQRGRRQLGAERRAVRGHRVDAVDRHPGGHDGSWHGWRPPVS